MVRFGCYPHLPPAKEIGQIYSTKRIFKQKMVFKLGSRGFKIRIAYVFYVKKVEFMLKSTFHNNRTIVTRKITVEGRYEKMKPHFSLSFFDKSSVFIQWTTKYY